MFQGYFINCKTRKLGTSLAVPWLRICASQKSLSFLYTNDEKSEREIKETLPFTTATKRIKYLGINLPKETKDLCAENYQTLMKEIKNGTNRWRDIYHVLGLEESILENDYTTQNNIGSMQSLSNYNWHFSQNYNKQFHNLYGNREDPE